MNFHEYEEINCQREQIMKELLSTPLTKNSLAKILDKFPRKEAWLVYEDELAADESICASLIRGRLPHSAKNDVSGVGHHMSIAQKREWLALEDNHAYAKSMHIRQPSGILPGKRRTIEDYQIAQKIEARKSSLKNALIKADFASLFLDKMKDSLTDGEVLDIFSAVMKEKQKMLLNAYNQNSVDICEFLKKNMQKLHSKELKTSYALFCINAIGSMTFDDWHENFGGFMKENAGIFAEIVHSAIKKENENKDRYKEEVDKADKKDRKNLPDDFERFKDPQTHENAIKVIYKLSTRTAAPLEILASLEESGGISIHEFGFLWNYRLEAINNYRIESLSISSYGELLDNHHEFVRKRIRESDTREDFVEKMILLFGYATSSNSIRPEHGKPANLAYAPVIWDTSNQDMPAGSLDRMRRGFQGIYDSNIEHVNIEKIIMEQQPDKTRKTARQRI